MSRAGLTFEQAPPFSLPLRFFLTAPLFLFVAGILIAVSPDALASRWTPAALALTHALTLGFLAMVMLGALMQMLPVVAGVPVPVPGPVARVSHVALTLGTAALIAAFEHGETWTYGLAIALLAGGFAVFLVAVAVSLARAAAGATVNAIRLAVLALALTVLLGIALALLRAGAWAPPALEVLVAGHPALGLIGWVLLLVIGVAWQVVPMFQLTPPYAPALSRSLAGVLFVLLLLYPVVLGVSVLAARGVALGIACGVLLFAVATLRLQARRRRKLPDVTFDYWRFAMTSLIASVGVWLLAQGWPGWADHDAYPVLLGVLFLGGFAVSVVNGMLYKIVPFLAWFHLQAQLRAKAGSIPTMKEMIDARAMRLQFRLHVAACGLLAVTLVWPQLAVGAGVVLALSALALWRNLLAALRRFSAHGGRYAVP